MRALAAPRHAGVTRPRGSLGDHSGAVPEQHIAHDYVTDALDAAETDHYRAQTWRAWAQQRRSIASSTAKTGGGGQLQTATRPAANISAIFMPQQQGKSGSMGKGARCLRGIRGQAACSHDHRRLVRRSQGIGRDRSWLALAGLSAGTADFGCHHFAARSRPARSGRASYLRLRGCRTEENSAGPRYARFSGPGCGVAAGLPPNLPKSGDQCR